MKNIVIAACFSLFAGVVASACATSGQEQQRALAHQRNSDNAAANGQYGIAGSEERKAEDSHHKAAVKAIDEGKRIPPETKPGDVPASDSN
jgi:hypothetical protein